MAYVTAETNDQNKPAGVSASELGFPCVATRNVPIITSAIAKTSRLRGRRWLLMHRYSTTRTGGNVLDYRCRTRVRVLNCEQIGNLARRQAKHRKNYKRAHGISISPHRKKRTTRYCKGKCAQYDTSAQHSNRRHPERINIVMMKEVLRTGAREAPTDASEQRKAETSYVL